MESCLKQEVEEAARVVPEAVQLVANNEKVNSEIQQLPTTQLAQIEQLVGQTENLHVSFMKPSTTLLAK